MDGETINSVSDCTPSYGSVLRTYPQYFLPFSIENVRLEAPVRTKSLPLHGASNTEILLCHVAHVIARSIHDGILICLLETNDHVHELKLPRHNQRAIREDGGCWVFFVKHAIRVWRDVYW